MNIFLREEPPSRTEVSTTLIEIIDNAQHSIQIIQPYYLPIQDVDDAILKALERGVKVEIITARKRD
jgi:cardiolipin synthase